MPLQPHAIAALVVLVLFEIQANVRFGAKARKVRATALDHGSSAVLSITYLLVALGFAVSQRLGGLKHIDVPSWFIWPGPTPLMVGLAWTGVALASAGLVLRLWAVLTLRHRFTRTLLIADEHTLERKGPYRVVRHPGYLGSLLFMNGFALASTSLLVFVVGLAATSAAYAYRIHAEDRMLIEQFGAAYEEYRREVAAVIPFIW